MSHGVGNMGMIRSWFARWVILILILISEQGFSAQEESHQTIFYIPFSSTTTIPVGFEGIEKTKCKIEVLPDDEKYIKEILSRKSLSLFSFFNANSVRVKVENVFPDSIFLDRSGLIKTKEKSFFNYKLAKLDFDDFKNFLVDAFDGNSYCSNE